MATTSNSGQPHLPDHDHHHENKDFIAREMELTKEAMTKTAGEIWQHVPSTEDVAAWTKANPMLAVGIAAGAGLLAGFMVAPSRGGKSSGAHHEGGGGGGMLGSLVGAVMPAVSLAVSEVSRTAVAAAVAHFAGQQAAEQHAQENVDNSDPFDTYPPQSSTEAA